MTDSVFLDTNLIRNPDVKTFFGNITKLQQISRLAQIYIPCIVIEEIKWQKLEKLRSSLDTFRDNYFSSLFKYKIDDLKQHISNKIEELYKSAKTEIDFIEIALKKDLEHIDHLKDLAVQKIAPFETKNDKGFKDAYIYLTVNQYLSENRKHLFLFTNDGKLKEAFSDNKLVTVLTEPEQYFSYRSAYFQETYFLETLNSEFNGKIRNGELVGLENEVTISVNDIIDIFLTEHDEWVINIRLGKFTFEVVADFYSKEIIDVVQV